MEAMLMTPPLSAGELEELERLANAVTDGVEHYGTRDWKAVAKLYTALEVNCTPDRILRLVAAVRRGEAAAALSCGRPWLGEATTPSLVCWIAADEAPGDAVRRAQAFGADGTRWTLLDPPRSKDELRREVLAIRPALLVVDTLSAVAHPWLGDADENSASAWTPIMAFFSRLARESDAAIVLLHHAPKGSATYRGSTAIGAGVDMIMVMTEPNEESGEDSARRNSKCRGRWYVAPFAVHYTGRDYVLAGADSSRETMIYDAVCVTAGLSKSKLAENLPLRKQVALDLIDAAIRSGRIVSVPGLGGSRLYPKGAEPELPERGSSGAGTSGNHSRNGAGNHPSSGSRPPPSEPELPPTVRAA